MRFNEMMKTLDLSLPFRRSRDCALLDAVVTDIIYQHSNRLDKGISRTFSQLTSLKRALALSEIETCGTRMKHR